MNNEIKTALTKIAATGASFINFDAITVPVLTGGKSNPMQGRVTKVTRGVNALIASNSNTNTYQNMVNNALEKSGIAGTFEPHERKWGERIKGTALVSHKGKEYLEAIVTKGGTVEYFLDGAPIDRENIVGLKESAAPKSQTSCGLSEEKAIVVRDYDLANITRLATFGEVVE